MTIKERLMNLDENFWTLEEFQELIDDENYNLSRPTDLLKFEKRLYNRAQYLKFLNKLKFKTRRRNCDNIKHGQQVQDIIDDYCIGSPSELKSFSQGIYKKYKKFKNDFNFKFKSLSFGSLDEKQFSESLISYGITDFETQYVLI